MRNANNNWGDPGNPGLGNLSASQPEPTPQEPAAPTLEQLEQAVAETHDAFQRAMQAGKDYQREANAFNDACQRLASQSSQLTMMGIGQL